MRRRLLTLASAISLLLCLTTAVLWVRSYWVSDALEYTTLDTSSGFFQVTSIASHQSGLVEISYHPLRGNAVRTWRRWVLEEHMRLFGGFAHRKWAANRPSTVAAAMAFHWGHTPIRYFDCKEDTYYLVAPFWAVCLALAALPAARFIRHRVKLRRSLRGYCDCGYDLTGNTSGVCPECGTPVPQKSEVSI